ncbi:NUDIX hydrolase [Nocardioides sp.]|uniref:NUDIX hydrolase n=1 Tax=Nocardioides sp. TaxID=35761 RepID=UPI00271B8D84|nr:NUDIX hydrolase [Nocardioides sp.]MDO9454600.1 NUDIX hydrolase [Nocardioides sp.]
MTETSGPAPWTRAGDDELAYDGFARILRRPLVLPDGRQALWDIHDSPATVSVLALTDDDEVVLVQQYRPGPDRVVLSLPGGLVDDGEEPVAAGVRELREETGYAVASAELVASIDPPSHTRSRHVVLARGAHAVGEQQLDDLEEIDVVLLPVAELRRRLPGGRLGATEQTYLALDHAGLL